VGAAVRADVDLGPLAHDDAARLALLRAVTTEAPKVHPLRPVPLDPGEAVPTNLCESKGRVGKEHRLTDAGMMSNNNERKRKKGTHVRVGLNNPVTQQSIQSYTCIVTISFIQRNTKEKIQTTPVECTVAALQRRLQLLTGLRPTGLL
jgi:hypothetical protein